jgi:preprotein translocase subunit SecB
MKDATLSKFRHSHPQITSFEYKICDDLQEGKIDFSIQYDKHIEKIDCNHAVISLTIEMKPIGSDGPFCIRCSGCIMFEWDMDDENVVNQILAQTAPSVLVSYMRPLISIFTHSSGLPAFELPLLDFSQEGI